MKNMIFLLLVLLLPSGVEAQKASVIPMKGLVLDNGVWQAPTPATVLRDLLANAAAREADLRQRYDARPAAELDAFTAELGRIMRDGSSRGSGNAEWALIKASSNSYGGAPYAGAADAFIQVYESFAEEDRPHQQRAKSALGGAFYVGGKDYVRNLFESSKKPPACNAPSDHMAPSAHAGEPLPQRIDLVRCETNTYGGGRGSPSGCVVSSLWGTPQNRGWPLSHKSILALYPPFTVSTGPKVRVCKLEPSGFVLCVQRYTGFANFQ